MEIVDPALDFLEFIILLAGICAICFTLILGSTKKMDESSYQVNYDKTVSSIKGEKPLTTEDGCFTAQQIALEVASQSPYLPSPISTPNIEDKQVRENQEDAISRLPNKNSHLKIGSEDLNLTELSQYSTSAAGKAFTAIKSWCAANRKDINNTRFKIMFDMGDSSSVTDNVYRLYYYDAANQELKPCK